jgi:GT2 family glycosyltransferase
MSHRTAVVILNWNTRTLLEKFLPLVIKYSTGFADIIVVDNASTDDSVIFLSKEFPQVKIIQNDVNDGYTGGYNAALSQIEYEFFVLLNSDVEVTENWLATLITFMDNNADAGACQPKILSYYEKEKFEYAGAAGGFIDLYGYPFCRGRIFNSIEHDREQYNDSIPVFWVSGACMMIRSSVFKKLNGFDPLFFAHMEEIDLCWRIYRSGMKVYYISTSKVYHVGGGTLHKSNPRKTYLNFRNNLLMLYKNCDVEKLKSILFMRVILDFIASVKFLFSGSFADFEAVWKAHKDFNKLKSRYSSPVYPPGQEENIAKKYIYPKSILWVYYICNKKKFKGLQWEKNQNL